MATTISTTLAAGSVASPYYYDVIITKQLCKKTCASKAPIFSPVFSLVGSKLVGTGLYELTVNVQGVVTYAPCGSCECVAKEQIVNENFVIPLYSAADPSSISVSGSVIGTKVQTSGCSNSGNIMVSDCILTLSVTAS